jgi:hypothetical protein
MHHPEEQRAISAHLRVWEDKLGTGARCRVCWARSFECFCNTLNERKKDIYSNRDIGVAASLGASNIKVAWNVFPASSPPRPRSLARLVLT